jgi:hypothetical protein
MRNDCILSFVSTKSAKQTYQTAAKLAGVSLAQWLRTRLNLQAVREIQRVDKKMELTDDEINRLFAHTLSSIERPVR